MKQIKELKKLSDTQNNNFQELCDMPESRIKQKLKIMAEINNKMNDKMIACVEILENKNAKISEVIDVITTKIRK